MTLEFENIHPYTEIQKPRWFVPASGQVFEGITSCWESMKNTIIFSSSGPFHLMCGSWCEADRGRSRSHTKPQRTRRTVQGGSNHMAFAASQTSA
ncbi:hypothetical protein KH990_10035 [Methanoculleus bourgensis]|nr:hypothetical protein [Methanoculleus bourgensis]